MRRLPRERHIVPTCGRIQPRHDRNRVHARRKFFDLHAANKSQIAEQALKFFGVLYDIERDIADMAPQRRQNMRRECAKPVADALHRWMIGQRERVSRKYSGQLGASRVHT